MLVGENALALRPLDAPVKFVLTREDRALTGTRSVSGKLILSSGRSVRNITMTWRPIGADKADEITLRLTSGSFFMSCTDPESGNEVRGEFVCARCDAELLQPGKYELRVRLTEV